MKILLADDDPVVTRSLKTILEATGKITIIGTGNSGSEAVELYRALLPDVLLMDIRMGEISGISAAEEILSEFPDARILFLTTFSDDEYITQALKIGARGYILKQDFEGIATALEMVMQGKTVFCSDVTEKIAGFLSAGDSFQPAAFDLSEKELEIIVNVAKGMSNKEIAKELYLSEGTVRNYISNILLKLKLRDRTQLAVFYYENIRQ